MCHYIFFSPFRTVCHSVGPDSNDISPPFLPLTILCDTAIQVSTRILVYSVLIFAKDHGVGKKKENIWEVGLVRLKRFSAPIEVGA